MENIIQPTNPASDTCGGAPRPAGTKDYICQDDKWVEVDVPGNIVKPEETE